VPQTGGRGDRGTLAIASANGTEIPRVARRELIQGLGLAALALLFTAMLLYAAFIAFGKADYGRAALFGVPGLICLYWSIRFTRTQLALRD
jgi:hypothetical protein